MARKTSNKPNILLIAVDSLRRDRMSLYGYKHQTTPHIDKFAQGGTVFENTISPHVPTSPAYASMLTGRDCFGTTVVALRHKGGLPKDVPTLAEITRKAGYNTTCVGFGGNPANRGFDTYIDYEAWGSAGDGKAHKAEGLNDVTLPELDRLERSSKPWFMMLRHMDPHSPYLPPKPFDRLFYQGDEYDKKNKSLKPAMEFKPFCDYFASWIPEGVTDSKYVEAQYDGAVAYMDTCIQHIFDRLEVMGILDNTIVILNGDHGETLDEHECWFDHHGLYETNLVVPLVIRYPKKIPAGLRIKGYNEHKDLLPTILELAGIPNKTKVDGKSLMRLVKGKDESFDSEMYLTECTWMRKHGWRTPQWKLIVALEPDFHFKPEIELYNLIKDPHELKNVARQNPDVVATLRARMDKYIARREKASSNPNPMHLQGDWTGGAGAPFTSSQQAYDSQHIGNRNTARQLQSKSKK